MTHWKLVKEWEKQIDEKKYKAGLMLGDFVATMYQRGLLDKHIISSICDSGCKNRQEKWNALHEFVETFKGMLEDTPEDES